MTDTEKATLNEVLQDINTVRDIYEPILDDPDHATISDEHRKDIEKSLDISRMQLMTLIHKKEFITESMIKDVQGSKW
jgi:hypothetical protein